ncbi:MAG: hypothetical protein ACRECL_04910, partial [Bradyrhizobium sp.]
MAGTNWRPGSSACTDSGSQTWSGSRCLSGRASTAARAKLAVTRNIPPKLGVRSYPVVERYHLIFIWTGDSEKADPS